MPFDFDKAFRIHFSDWLAKHEDEYENADQIEEVVLEVYEEFLNTENKALGGKSPLGYFKSINSPDELIALMQQYLDENMSLPSLLSERMEEVDSSIEKPLLKLLMDESTPEDGRCTIICVFLGRKSDIALRWAVNEQMNREFKDDMADCALEYIQGLIDSKIEGIEPELNSAIGLCSDAGKEALLSLLCQVDKSDSVLEGLLELMEKYPDRRALLAACLGQLGREEAIEPLKAYCLLEETEYLDYIELKNAIDRLGGDAPEREFDESDPAAGLFSAAEEGQEHFFHGEGDKKAHFDGLDLGESK